VCGAAAVDSRRLLIGPADVDVNAGDTVLLECAAKRYNAATGISDITWTRDGQSIVTVITIIQ